MHFLNLGHAYETTSRLATALIGEHPTADIIDRSYRQAITTIRRLAPPDHGRTITFEDGEWGRYLIDNNVFEAIFVGIDASDGVQRGRWQADVEHAFAYVAALNPDLGRLIDLLVTDVVVLNSERTGGGSASHIPGLVCISPGPHWQMVDFAESLVHEAIHLNLFIEDMVYGMYTLPTSDLADDQYRVLSAVKVGELRPLDKAFHSAVVAVPLMYMQDRRGESTLVDQFAVSLRECTDGLIGKRQFFTEYGQMLVDELRKFAVSLDFEYVENSISSDQYAYQSLRI
ncbi:aKG-HExxH-type peptide beta-hydroxylase [Mycobacteroides abscessus]|uniref:aKG-HExxH-type peptide beta-hydroxylase n=1 Tax=Mycobacteroides abscessus TaxID=36809 RepID=UPI00210543F3|nr:HEXXH motif-containing putative peptide modification protein [Mycobacteroides abscessus]